jgi:iron(III) transport system ATP-binding protein
MKGLVICGVRKSFGPQPVLRGIDLEVPEGSFTAILGPSGSGKTTLLRIIAGFERPDAGTVRLGSQLVDDAGDNWVPCEKRRIGYVPQEGALFPHLSVGRNVSFGLDRSLRKSARVNQLLELVGLAGLARRYPHQLSGGQQQRVALARALATDPEIVLLDEPFASLDASLRASVRADVQDVLRLANTTAILVTHDQDEALSMADQVAVLRDGVIGQIDAPSGLYGLPRDPELAQFLGEANLLDGMIDGQMVTTALGLSPMMPGVAQAEGSEGSIPHGPARVMVRPEQFLLSADDGSHERGVEGVPGVVRSYEYFGHDAVVRVQPDADVGVPELVVRITGGQPWRSGAKVRLKVHGSVVAWLVEKSLPATPE